MNIQKALQTEDDVRVTYGSRWLIWNDEWIVYELKRGQRKPRIIIQTQDEQLAVKVLKES